MPEIQFISKSRIFPYGTTQLRCVQPAGYLQKSGWTCRLGCVYRNMPQASRAIVFHRAIGDPHTWSYLSYAKAKGLVLIYDVDDYLFDEVADSNAPKYREIMKEFDVVFASTEFLAERISSFHSDVRVVQSGLSESFVDNLKSVKGKSGVEQVQDGQQITIGYFSGSAHHDQDFKLVEDSLLKILKEHSHVRLLLIGKLSYSDRFAEFGKQFEYRSFMPYEEFQKVFQEVDVNLAPNRIGHPKAQGRSEIKFVEAGAWNVPTIASPTETYKSVIQHGVNGLLAEDDAWMKQLVDVVTNNELRNRLGRQVGDDISNRYFPDAKINEWKQLLDNVMGQYETVANARRRSFQAPFKYLNSFAHWTKRFLRRTKRDLLNSERKANDN